MKTRKARVLNNGELVGFLSESKDGYVFAYEEKYLRDASKPAISFAFPKQAQAYEAKSLFPLFFGLLAEGENKAIQCRTLRIDEKDHFTRLLKTAHTETIGAITVREENENQ